MPIEQGGTIWSPADGKIVPITEVPDKVFSEKILGDGFAVIPSGSQIVAPVSGTVTTVFRTLHAYGIKTDDGIDVLVHIGLDTVKLGGEGFTSPIQKGQRVKTGDVLCTVDSDFIKNKGYDLITPVVITNMKVVRGVTVHDGDAKAGTTIALAYKLSQPPTNPPTDKTADSPKKSSGGTSFEEQSAEMVDYLGGADNITTATHCVTRLRLALADPKKAEIDKIEELPSVKGTFTQAGQFQVIIGPDVQDFFNAFTSVSGVKEANKEAVKEAAKANQNILQRGASTLAEIFSPIIPALVVGGLLLGLRNVIGEIKFIGDGPMDTRQTLADTSVFWKGSYEFLWLIGWAVFHMLPVLICWTVTKKMKCTEALGIVLGLTLVSPDLVNAYEYTKALHDGTLKYYDFGFAQMEAVGYQGQVIPAILAALVFCYLERLMRKIIHPTVSMIFVPLFSLLPAVILAHAIIGPIGWAISDWISTVVSAGLTSSVNWLFGGVFGFVYAPLVITGLHHTTNAIDLAIIGADPSGGTPLWPMIALSNIAQGSAVVAVMWLHRKDKKERQVSLPAAISAYLGVTEPALFGINLKLMYPMLGAMTGSALAAISSMVFNTHAASIGVGGIPGILSILPQYWGPFAISMLIAIIGGIFFTILYERIGVQMKAKKKNSTKKSNASVAAA